MTLPISLQIGDYVEFTLPWSRNKAKRLGIVKHMTRKQGAYGKFVTHVTIKCGDVDFILNEGAVSVMSPLEQLAMVAKEK